MVFFRNSNTYLRSNCGLHFLFATGLIALSTNTFAASLTLASKFAENGTYVGPGVFAENSALIVRSVDEHGMTTSKWPIACHDYRCIPRAADANAVFVIEGDTTEASTSARHDYWNTSAVAAYGIIDGKQLWRTPIAGDKNFLSAEITEYAGRKAVVVLNDRAAIILDALTGKRLDDLAAPKEISSKEFAQYASKVKPYTTTRVLAPSESMHIWAFPNGLVYGMSGDTVSWKLNLQHDNSEDLASHPNTMVQLNPTQILIVYTQWNSYHEKVKALVINIADGTVAELDMAGSSVALDSAHWYLRTNDGIAVYDRQTLKPVWSLNGLSHSSSAQSIEVDDSYVYTVAESRTPGGRSQRQLKLLDKHLGTPLSSYQLSEYVDGLTRPLSGHGIIVKQRFVSGSGDTSYFVNNSVVVSVKP
ncbi:MAG: hypothetical protein NTV34_11855 [Proteobacteria bacterium]|nr:hypothetical protein [Pseudomonadota bacterium]